MNQQRTAPPPTQRCLTGLRRSAALAVTAFLTAGCPEQTSAPPAPNAPCREVGQRCEFAPGKLGSCVLNDNCQGPSCYICQSQH
jgi:hypothetical protein